MLYLKKLPDHFKDHLLLECAEQSGSLVQAQASQVQIVMSGDHKTGLLKEIVLDVYCSAYFQGNESNKEKGIQHNHNSSRAYQRNFNILKQFSCKDKKQKFTNVMLCGFLPDGEHLQFEDV